MRTETAPQPVYLSDYAPPVWRARHTELTVQIFEAHTDVTAIVSYKGEDAAAPLVLNAEDMEIRLVKVNGQEADFTYDGSILTISNLGNASSTIEITNRIDPSKNTRLEGLYMSNGTWCTQCEAEGFRRITPYVDRPDNMGTWRVRIEADAKTCPVLLSNGNLIKEGKAAKGRHFTLWDDPTPKPAHLFALVAGDLKHIQDEFVTMSGRKVDLRIYVREGDEGQCQHAMISLQKSMKWDEDVYGREYQYDRFNIVAVSDFNMGAMENTSLNIFNTALVLAHPETATDMDFLRVESVIAHEYFHNWTGNRVGCQNWFQLSLKEGLTVFRDQMFSADMNSAAVQRIDDVTHLRRLQFPEDAGPLAHPIRPDNYIEINNFYTMTVYEKGAEVIRMIYNLLGPETYRQATDLYFERHDGDAVTCEDWIQAMADASGRDLSSFWNWYTQAGTPEVSIDTEFNDKTKQYTIKLKQNIKPTPGQPKKNPVLIPVKLGLIGPNGEDMLETVLEFSDDQQSFTFEGIGSRPVPSLFRGFSAPVKIKSDLKKEDYAFLAVHDKDGFNRWDATQTLYVRDITSSGAYGTTRNTLLSRLLGHSQARKKGDTLLSIVSELLEQALSPNADHALIARMLQIPGIDVAGQHVDIVDPAELNKNRDALLNDIRHAYASKIRTLYDTLLDTGAFEITPQAMGRRALKNTLLKLLNDPVLAKAQYDKATNMTDRIGALSVLTDFQSDVRDAVFADFLKRFKDYQLVVDKWFSLQAVGVHAGTLDLIKSLSEHDLFTLKNPNRVRALYAAFAMNNPVKFHTPDGTGYDLLADTVIKLNKTNPQIAARLLTPMRDWKRYTPALQAQMQSALKRIEATPDLSPDVFEIVSKTLAAS